MDHLEDSGSAAASLLTCRPRAVTLYQEQQPGELGRQKNRGEETRTKFTHREYYGGDVIGTIRRVCYGTFNGKSACFIVFNFSFHWPQNHQFTQAEIQISFNAYSEPSDSSKEITKPPIVRNLSPRKIHGVPNTNGQMWCFNVEQQCEVPLEPKPTTSAPKGMAFKEEHRVEIVGRMMSHTRQSDPHQGCWIVKERGKPTFGIPDEFVVAILVEHEGKFKADVKVSTDISVHRKLRGFPWPPDDPVLFIPGGPGPLIGKAPITTKFEILSEADWNSFMSDYEGLGSRAGIPPRIEASKAVTLQGPIAYRVQGIPSQYVASTALRFLRTLLELDKNDDAMELRSISSDPRSATHEKIGILMASRLTMKLGDGDRWNKALPYVEQGATIEKKIYVTFDTTFHDFTVLGNPEGEHDLDIIALPGLGGHPFRSFKERAGNHMWLIDDLPFDFSRARVLVYGYDTKLADSQSFQDIESLASSFRLSLKTIRHDTPDMKPNDKPIIFITHSLGGIILKEALIQMVKGKDEKDMTNAKVTRGILFFGVPSQGMEIDSLREMVAGQANEPFLQSLRQDSDTLRNQSRQFCELFPFESCEIISFFETELSPTVKKEPPHGFQKTGEPKVLVTQTSATAGSRSWETGPNYAHAIKRNHSDMVKFYPRDPIYHNVKYLLSTLVEKIYKNDEPRPTRTGTG